MWYSVLSIDKWIPDSFTSQSKQLSRALCCAKGLATRLQSTMCESSMSRMVLYKRRGINCITYIRALFSEVTWDDFHCVHLVSLPNWCLNVVMNFPIRATFCALLRLRLEESNSCAMLFICTLRTCLLPAADLLPKAHFLIRFC